MSKQVEKPDFGNFSQSQKRSAGIAVIVAIVYGAYFLRQYFILICVASIVAYLFLPIYKRLLRRFGTGASAALTFLLATLLVLIPLIGFVLLAAEQIRTLAENAGHLLNDIDIGKLGNSLIDTANNTLDNIPFLDVHLTTESIKSSLSSIAHSVGNWLLNTITSLAGSVFGAITTSIIFIYVFLSVLINHRKLAELIEKLNPLGPEVSRMYMQKAGDMVHGAVGGQFIIAVIQGFTGALSIYIAGFHSAFFVMALIFTLMSLIPLGSGIITIPLGVGMMFFGNVPGGLFVILWHIIGITNIDNILRPILIPKSARLDPALMLLTVFAGLSMFGFWGLFIGPVIMILIVTTIKVYLAVYRDTPMVYEDEIESPKKRRKLLRLKRKAKKS